MAYQPLNIVRSFQRKLYFLSDKNMDGKTIRPRIPKTWVQGYEDGKTARICCSPSIGGCMRAINTYGGPSQIMYLHEIEDVESIVANGCLVKPTKDRVFDVDRTNEYWIMCPAKLKCKGKVQIGYQWWYDHVEKGGDEYEKPHVKFHYIEKYHQNESVCNMNKKSLYESIIQQVAIEVKKALCESEQKPSAFVLKTLRQIKDETWRNLPSDEALTNALIAQEDLAKKLMGAKFPAAGIVTTGLEYTSNESDPIEIAPDVFILLETSKEIDSTSRDPRYRGTSKTHYYIYRVQGGRKHEIAHTTSSRAFKWSDTPAEAKLGCKINALLDFLKF